MVCLVCGIFHHFLSNTTICEFCHLKLTLAIHNVLSHLSSHSFPSINRIAWKALLTTDWLSDVSRRNARLDETHRCTWASKNTRVPRHSKVRWNFAAHTCQPTIRRRRSPTSCRKQSDQPRESTTARMNQNYKTQQNINISMSSHILWHHALWDTQSHVRQSAM